MNGEDPLDQAGPVCPDIDPDALLDGAAAADLKDDEPKGAPGDTQVAALPLALAAPYLIGGSAGALALGYMLQDRIRSALDGPRADRRGSSAAPRTDMADPPPPTPGFEGEAPDFDQAPGRPVDPDAAGGDTFIFPDGTTVPADGSPPPSEDQSDVLPQGTVLMVKDGAGNEFDIDVSGAPKRAHAQLRRHLNQIPTQGVRDVVTGLTAGGKLTTGGSASRDTTQITQSGHEDPGASAKQAFDDIVREAGGDPAKIEPSPNNDGVMRWAYELPDGSIVQSRSDSSKKGTPTNDVQIYRPEFDDKNPVFKVRYER
jgi:hypothetical protein